MEISRFMKMQPKEGQPFLVLKAQLHLLKIFFKGIRSGFEGKKYYYLEKKLMRTFLLKIGGVSSGNILK